jgi:hypothetical protein
VATAGGVDLLLLLVDSLLWCSSDASVAVTDATIRVRVTLRLPVSQSSLSWCRAPSWRSAFLYFFRYAARGPMGVGAAMVSPDWVALVSLWETPTSSFGN